MTLTAEQRRAVFVTSGRLDRERIRLGLQPVRIGHGRLRRRADSVAGAARARSRCSTCSRSSLAFALGVWASDVVIRRLGIEDPGVVVWDEFVGQWIALLPLVVAPRGWLWIVAAFVLFRMFDVWKPWPASWADRHVKGGFGAMLDDVFAGAYAALVLAVAIRVI